VRKLALYAGLTLAAAYFSAGAALWASQRHLIFEPVRELAVQPAELGFPVDEVLIPVRGGRGTQWLQAWWMPAARPDAKVVLYLHGNEGNVSTSLGKTQLLRQLGYSVLAVDYRGYGRSDGRFPSEGKVYKDAEAALAALAGEWVANPRDIYVYGHSLGAAIAIDLAVKHPELGGLIVESGFTSIYDMASLEPKYEIFPVGLLINQRFESIKKVPQLELPVLYIHGTADRVVPYRMGVTLFEHSGGTKRLLTGRGGGLDDNAEVAPSQLRAAIAEFMGGSQPAAIPDLAGTL
jgi:pimeloyl-ACP methyl ester carboxylesterase